VRPTPPLPPDEPEAVAGLQPPPAVPEHQRSLMSATMDKIVLAIVYTALFLTAYVVVVGGIVCIITDEYHFTEYITDLREMSNWVLVASIVVAAKLLAPFVRIQRTNGP